MEKYYYGYDEFIEDTKRLVSKVSDFEPDTLLAIARGGVTLGHFMAEALGTNRLFVLNSIHYDGTKKLDTFEIFNIPDLKDAKKVLLIDDISDSGETFVEILGRLEKLYPEIEFRTVSIFYKKSSLHLPHYCLKEANGWIDFLWEVDP
jgi:xanthine phosphoribosyltransferase